MPEINDLPIVKIVLQLLIENASIHGIFEKEDPLGHIAVRSWRVGGDIFMTVADDGVCMDAQTLRANFLPEHVAKFSPSGGYGIRNIHKRLRIFYGPGYGLSPGSWKYRDNSCTRAIKDCGCWMGISAMRQSVSSSELGEESEGASVPNLTRRT